MAHTVIGLFRNSTEAYKAYNMLKERGFDHNNVDVSTNYGSYDDSNERERPGKVGEFFKSLFGNDEEDASRYQQAVHNNALITVHARSRDEAEDAADILDECEAINVNEKESEVTGRTSDTSYQEKEARTISSSNEDRTKEASIPIIEEKVDVGKREVQRGGVRVRSRIIERPVAETLRLREEHVHVERNPVNRDATEADLRNFQEGTIEINEFAEEAIVSKKARVVEEVKVGVDVEERNETINETERKTEVVVEDFVK